MNLNELINRVHRRINTRRPATSRKVSQQTVDRAVRLAFEVIAEELGEGGEFHAPALGRLRTRSRDANGANVLAAQASSHLKMLLRRAGGNSDKLKSHRQTAAGED